MAFDDYFIQQQEDCPWTTVSALTEEIKACLEGTFRQVKVEGEISNCRPSSTGHLYFTLKDEGASLSAVMFKNRLRSLSLKPADGMRVRVSGSLSVYPQRGSYQVIVESIEQAGEGAILAMLEERKRRLAAEGLFDSARKPPLPEVPWHVAVVTSQTGAALRDILQVLRRRAPGMRVTILPAVVQGSEAAASIAARIRQANSWQLGEVLIVGRGGGSLEDLLPFSDEEVVRAVAESSIPMISAVGHEVDWALCDYAASLRAPTPSAAAELVSARHGEERPRMEQVLRRMGDEIRSRLERCRLLLRPFKSDNLELAFRSILQPRMVRFDDAREELILCFRDLLRAKRQRLSRSLAILETANPAEVLARGFAIVRDGESGAILRRAEDSREGAALSIQLSQGEISARVQSIQSGGRS